MANNNDARIDAFFRIFQNRINAAIAQLPPIVGNLVVNDALDNFRKQSFDGQPWKARKGKTNRGNGRQNILVQSGALRRSIRVIRTTANSVTVGSDLPYADVHNNGGEIRRKARSETFVRNRYTRGKRKGKFARGTTAGQGYSFKAYRYRMPKRQFLGRSAALDTAINRTVKRHILNALRLR
ncbi:phage virion morphogenesis protein [Sphingobacterium spiritivorum]|nr:phage virion morphogenesis protein [Sphingobacterium spiritivorum]